MYKIIVVAQYYDTDVNKEYAIRGNSAILKCVVPSFVADFVKVLSWHTDQGEEFVPSDDFGINKIRDLINELTDLLNMLRAENFVVASLTYNDLYKIENHGFYNYFKDV